MEAIRFTFYYIGKVLSVGLGAHRTDNPLGLKWRWKYWKKMQKSKSRKHDAYNTYK
jgi:hypothetical protein